LPSEYPGKRQVVKLLPSLPKAPVATTEQPKQIPQQPKTEPPQQSQPPMAQPAQPTPQPEQEEPKAILIPPENQREE